MTPIPLTPGYLAVMVPEGATQIRIGKASGNLHFYLGFARWIELPPGQYDIVGMSNEIGEDMVKWIVSGNNGGVNDTRWQDYDVNINLFAIFTKHSPTESLATLLSSKGITGNCLIIKID